MHSSTSCSTNQSPMFSFALSCCKSASASLTYKCISDHACKTCQCKVTFVVCTNQVEGNTIDDLHVP